MSKNDNEMQQAPERNVNPIALLKQKMEAHVPNLIVAANNDRARAERLVGIMLRFISTKPEFLACNVESIIRCARYCAEVGLEPGEKGEVYLIPYGSELTAQLSYKGEIALAYRTGKVKKIIGRGVYQGDVFRFNAATDEIEHVPTFNEDERGDIIAAYARAEMKDGTSFVAVLSRADIERHRARSKTKNSASSPWATDYAPMAVKSAMHELAKWLPGFDPIPEPEYEYTGPDTDGPLALPAGNGKPNNALRAGLASLSAQQ